MLDNHYSLSKGDHYNLPSDLAESLVAAKKAVYPDQPSPSETNPAEPSEKKVVAPSQRKGKSK